MFVYYNYEVIANLSSQALAHNEVVGQCYCAANATAAIIEEWLVLYRWCYSMQGLHINFHPSSVFGH